MWGPTEAEVGVRVLTQGGAGNGFSQEVMKSLLDVDSVKPPYMGLSD